MSILYRVHRVAAAASPQLLQAAIRRHTPSTTDVVPLPLAGRGRQVIEAWSHSSWQAGKPSYRRAVPYHPGEKRVTGTKKERMVSALFPYLLYPGPGQ